MPRRWKGASTVYLTLQIAGSLLLFVASGPSNAQDGTAAQRRACKPDVFRLCSKFIPNRKAITQCLEANRSGLSPDCRAVFNGTLK